MLSLSLARPSDVQYPQDLNSPWPAAHSAGTRECTDMTHLFDISRVPLCCSHWLASICRPLQNLLNPLVESIRIESELRQLRLECLRCSWRRNERQREQ